MDLPSQETLWTKLTCGQAFAEFCRRRPMSPHSSSPSSQHPAHGVYELCRRDLAAQMRDQIRERKLRSRSCCYHHNRAPALYDPNAAARGVKVLRFVVPPCQVRKSISVRPDVCVYCPALRAALATSARMNEGYEINIPVIIAGICNPIYPIIVILRKIYCSIYYI